MKFSEKQFVIQYTCFCKFYWIWLINCDNFFWKKELWRRLSIFSIYSKTLIVIFIIWSWAISWCLVMDKQGKSLCLANICCDRQHYRFYIQEKKILTTINNQYKNIVTSQIKQLFFWKQCTWEIFSWPSIFWINFYYENIFFLDINLLILFENYSMVRGLYLPLNKNFWELFNGERSISTLKQQLLETNNFEHIHTLFFFTLAEAKFRGLRFHLIWFMKLQCHFLSLFWNIFILRWKFDVHLSCIKICRLVTSSVYKTVKINYQILTLKLIFNIWPLCKLAHTFSLNDVFGQSDSAWFFCGLRLKKVQ